MVSKRVVAVTGGTLGIGRAVVERFLGEGYEVAVSSRSPREVNLPTGVLHCRLDARQRDAQRRFAAKAVEVFGRLDVFINCAGISRWKPLKEIDEAFAAQMIETNILGVLWGCAAASEHMGEGGSIVNVSSLAGKRGSMNNSVYCASKFAVNGITQSLAKELGPRGIRVNAVCPVYVETQTILAALSDPVSPAGGKRVDTYLASFAEKQTALGRLPSEVEVAETIYFLTSQAASAITGQCINVDCGTFPQ